MLRSRTSTYLLTEYLSPPHIHNSHPYLQHTYPPSLPTSLIPSRTANNFPGNSRIAGIETVPHQHRNASSEDDIAATRYLSLSQTIPHNASLRRKENGAEEARPAWRRRVRKNITVKRLYERLLPSMYLYTANSGALAANKEGVDSIRANSLRELCSRHIRRQYRHGAIIMGYCRTGGIRSSTVALL